jgi:hypothetical protein
MCQIVDHTKIEHVLPLIIGSIYDDGSRTRNPEVVKRRGQCVGPPLHPSFFEEYLNNHLDDVVGYRRVHVGYT